MQRKISSSAIALFVGFISWAVPKYLEVNNVITQQNSYWLLYAIYIGAFIVICVLIWGFWDNIRVQWPLRLYFKVKSPLRVTVQSVSIGSLLYDNNQPIIQFKVRLTLEASSEIQLGKLELIYEGQPNDPVKMPTTLVKHTEAYEVEYRVWGNAGKLLIQIGLASERDLPQIELKVLAGGLEPFTIPIPKRLLTSHMAGYQT